MPWADGSRRSSVEHRQAVFDGGRVGVFGAEPVIDRDHRSACLVRQLGADIVMTVETADDKAAAMEVDNGGDGMRRSGQIAPDRYLVTAGGDVDVIDTDALRPRMAQRGAQFVVDLPLTVGRSFPSFIRRDLCALRDEGEDFRFGRQMSRWHAQ